MFEKYYCVRQQEMKDCGAACLATISRQYGLKIPISKIKEIAGTDKEGTSVYGLITAAENIGFSAKGVKTQNKRDIFGDISVPAIAHLIVDDSYLHYVVIHKITKKYIIVADPSKGIVKYNPRNFLKLWSGVLVLLVPNIKFKKGNETKGLFERFWGLLTPQKGLLINIFICSLLITALGIASSFYFQFLIDEVVPSNLNYSLHIISIVMILIIVFKIGIEFFRGYLLLFLGQRIDIPLMLGYYEHVINLPMNFFSSRQVGDIISRFNDAGKIREAISSTALTVMIDGLMVIVGGVILFSKSSKLFLMTLIPVTLYAVIVIVFKNPIKRINEKTMESNAVLTSYLVESINGIETVKALNGERYVKNKTESKFIKFIKNVFKDGFTNSLQGTIKDTIKGIFGIVILWVGVISVLNNSITMGELLTFNSLLVYFLDPIENIINLQETLQTAIVASERLGEILDLEIEKKNESDKIYPREYFGAIEFKGVNFRYGTRSLVLKDINMRINPGEKVAVIGESGSGKSTLIKILMNFYKCEKGEVIIDGKNILDINIESLRENIAYISQDNFLFNGSIKENVSFGNGEATMDEIIDACKNAQIHDFINELPLRYNTLIEENGSNLSGGQKQRLAIARAILKKPKILIMDEATSSLDTITEKAITRTLDEFSRGITTIVIAHRLSTIMRCDKIYVLDKGKIVEEGNHYYLMHKDGMYRKLWQEQVPDDINAMSAW